MKSVYIIILNYNGYADTKLCLGSLHKLKGSSYKINVILVDNNSRLEEKIKLKSLLKKYPEVILIENYKNLGFAKGNNIGIRFALERNADYILLLNNDTIVESEFLRSLISLDVPISSPVVKFREFKDKNKLLFDMGGIINWWTGRTTHINAYAKEYVKKKNMKPFPVDYVAGCCMLIKKDVFKNVGLLDEKYFIYFEDVDFCVSAGKKGYKTFVHPKYCIYHKLGGAMDRWSKRAIFHNLYSNFIFITKHLGIRRLTGYVYLTILTIRIIKDRLIDMTQIPKKSLKLNWKGAKHNYEG